MFVIPAIAAFPFGLTVLASCTRVYRTIGDKHVGDFDLTFVVTNYRSGERLPSCLQSLQNASRDLRCQYLLIDNSPPEAERSLAGASVHNIQVINCDNLGYAAACNRGLMEARSPFVLFLNADTTYLSGSMGQLLQWLESRPQVALVGPKIVNVDGTRQLSCRAFPSWDMAIAHRHSLLMRLLPGNPVTHRYLRTDLDGQPRQVDWASGCCLLARKPVLESVGGFDEDFFLYFEDVDLAYRLKQLGWQAAYYPELTFVHELGVSREALPDRGQLIKHRSAARYFSKHLISNGQAARAFRLAAMLRGHVAAWLEKLRR